MDVAQRKHKERLQLWLIVFIGSWYLLTAIIGCLIYDAWLGNQRRWHTCNQFLLLQSNHRQVLGIQTLPQPPLKKFCCELQQSVNYMLPYSLITSRSWRLLTMDVFLAFFCHQYWYESIFLSAETQKWVNLPFVTSYKALIRLIRERSWTSFRLLSLNWFDLTVQQKCNAHKHTPLFALRMFSASSPQCTWVFILEIIRLKPSNSPKPNLSTAVCPVQVNYTDELW